MKTIIKLLVICVLSSAICRCAFAQGTAFTYQGELTSGSTDANGLYDFTFAVWNAGSGGAQQGAAFATNAVPVTNGYFIVMLDFGNVFAGNALRLEIGVRTNGAVSFTTLAPRQALTPAPYAVMAGSASNVLGTLPAVQLSGTVANGQLANNALTVNAGTGLGGGGLVSLGGLTTLNNAGVLALTGNGDITVSAASGNVTLGDTATSANTANTMVKRDASGNFSAGSLTLNGTLNLPTTAGDADVIYAGGNTLIHSAGTRNFFAGMNAGNLTMHGAENVGVGYAALFSNGSGEFNTANGCHALYSNGFGEGNTAIGCDTLYNNWGANANTALGYQALYNSTGADNIALGFQAGYNLTTGGNNIDIGNQGLATDTNIIRIGSGQTQTFIAGVVNGDGAGLTNLQALGLGNTAMRNFFAGMNAGNLTMHGAENVGVGYAALFSNGSGEFNTANGCRALYSNGFGEGNTAIGCDTLYNNWGANANTALGYQALYNSTGADNIALGFQAGYNLTTGGNNIDIGNQGLAGESGVIRIGTTGTHSSTYLAGTVNVGPNDPALQVWGDDTSSYADAKQIVIQGNSNPNQQLELGYKTSGDYGVIQAIHQNSSFTPLALQPSGGNVGIGTYSPGHPLTMGGGAYCTGSQWQNACDRNLKENFQPADPRAVLEQVAALPVATWNYKSEDSSVKHLGPTAQDFKAAFNLGDNDKSIGTVDEGGVALAAIQGLNQKMETENAALHTENAELKDQLKELKELVLKLTTHQKGTVR